MATRTIGKFPEQVPSGTGKATMSSTLTLPDDGVVSLVSWPDALADATGLLADQLIISTTNGPNHLRGTWIHPRLAVDLARWLSPAFAVWMDGWFLEQLHYNPATNVDSFRRAKQHAETLFAKLNAGSSRPVIRQRQVQSLNELAPCECLAMQYVAWRHWTQQPCETMHVIEVLQVRWKWSTIRNRLGTLRERGLITKEGRSIF